MHFGKANFRLPALFIFLIPPDGEKGVGETRETCSFETKLGQQSINSNKLNLMALCTQRKGRSSIDRGVLPI